MTLNINCKKNCISFKENENKIYGIDVSHYQNTHSKVDFQKLLNNKNPKISFIYIRATMGKDGVDLAFKENFKNAKKNGIKVGLYHYYRPNENSIEQFENFVKNVDKIGELPPVIDVEKMGDFGAKNLRQGISTFLNLMEKKYKKKPIIYSPQKFYNLYLRTHFSEYPIWIARQSGIKEFPESNQLKKEPVLFDQKCPLIWQYSGTGKVAGIEGFVDLNVANQIFW